MRCPRIWRSGQDESGAVYISHDRSIVPWNLCVAKCISECVCFSTTRTTYLSFIMYSWNQNGLDTSFQLVPWPLHSSSTDRRHACFLRCFRSFNLTICMLHTTKSCRSKNQWHGRFFTYNLSRVSVRHVDENFFLKRARLIALVDSLCTFCPTTLSQ